MNGGPETYQDISGIEIEGLDSQGVMDVGRAMKQARQRGASPKYRGHGHSLNANSDVSIRQQIAPLPLTSILTLVTTDITILPQRTFKLTRLVLVDNTDFEHSIMTVDNLKVGAENQFINNGSLPFQACAYNAVGCGLTGNTAISGRQLTLTVNNRAGGTRVVTGAFYGPAVDSD